MEKLLCVIFIALIYNLSMAQQKTGVQVITHDPLFNTLVDTHAKMEVLADGFQWTEGPVWIKKENIFFSQM